MPTLTRRHAGRLRTDCFRLDGHSVIGRSDVTGAAVDVDLGGVPEATWISPRHAVAWREADGRWFVRDEGSYCGTWVRPEAATEFHKITQPTALADGDEIAFGNARFEFRIAPSPNPTVDL